MKCKTIILVTYLTLSMIFLLITIFPISNYVEFYRALEKCQVQIDDVSLDLTKLNSGLVNLTVTFNVTNPTSFNGLQISTTTCNIRYFISNPQLQKQLPGKTETFAKPIEIPPHGNVPMIIKFTFDSRQQQLTVKEFIGLLLTKPNQINFIFRGQYILKAYEYSFAMPMGPFVYATNLN